MRTCIDFTRLFTWVYDNSAAAAVAAGVAAAGVVNQIVQTSALLKQLP